jgi:hypothetical protein
MKKKSSLIQFLDRRSIRIYPHPKFLNAWNYRGPSSYKLELKVARGIFIDVKEVKHFMILLE